MTLNLTERIDPAQDHRDDRLRAPGLHPRGRRRAGAPRRDQRRRPHPLLRRLLALGLPRGRRRVSALARARADAPEAAGRSDATRAIYRGTVRHRRSPAGPARRSATRSGCSTSTSTSCPTCSTQPPLWSARRPAPGRFRRDDYLGDPAVPLDERRPGRRRSTRSAYRPAGPVRLLTTPRTFGRSFNPVSFYYCFDAAGETRRVRRRRGHQHAVGRASRLRHGRARRQTASCAPRSTRSSTSRPSWAWTSATRWTLTRAGRDAERAHRLRGLRGPPAFDATLNLRREPLDRRQPQPPARALPVRRAADPRAHLRARPAPEAQGRALLPPSHPEPTMPR